MPGWMDRFNAASTDGGAGVQLKPEDVKKLEEIPEGFGKSFSELVESNKRYDKTLSAMDTFLAQQEQERKDREAAASEAAKKRKTAEVKPLDFENDFDDSLRQVLDPIAENQLRINARDLRRQILVEDEEFGEHYTGELKQRVDTMLDREPLANQNSPELIRNAYKTVAYDLRKEIADGKIKSRFAATQSRGNGTTGNANDKNTATAAETLSDEEKLFASKIGVTPDAFAKSKKDLGYV